MRRFRLVNSTEVAAEWGRFNPAARVGLNSPVFRRFLPFTRQPGTVLCRRRFRSRRVAKRESSDDGRVKRPLMRRRQSTHLARDVKRVGGRIIRCSRSNGSPGETGSPSRPFGSRRKARLKKAPLSLRASWIYPRRCG